MTIRCGGHVLVAQQHDHAQRGSALIGEHPRGGKPGPVLHVAGDSCAGEREQADQARCGGCSRNLQNSPLTAVGVTCRARHCSASRPAHQGRATGAPGAAANTASVSTNRLEAFSDGVFAVAITLLVLEIRVPAPGGASTLGHELLAQWPQYAAYVISFTTIGIIWINHHAAIDRLREADHTILMINLLLLLTVGLLPFATDVMATYLKESRGENLAAAVYSGAFLLMSLAFTLLNRQILIARSHLMVDPQTEELRRRTLRRAISGLVPYAGATALAAVSPYVTLAICAVIAAFYALPLSRAV
jgi:uncharacterized membrane protein